MDELEKAMAISISGPQRTRILRAFRKQVDRWHIEMPAARPLVLDFGLGQFESVGLVECWIANEVKAGYCGKYLFVADEQTCPLHHHRRKHETFFVVEGSVKVRFNGQSIRLKKGDTLAVPPRARHSFTGVGPALLLELSQPCLIDDNYFQDPRIPIGGPCRA